VTTSKRAWGEGLIPEERVRSEPEKQLETKTKANKRGRDFPLEEGGSSLGRGGVCGVLQEEERKSPCRPFPPGGEKMGGVHRKERRLQTRKGRQGRPAKKEVFLRATKGDKLFRRAKKKKGWDVYKGKR